MTTIISPVILAGGSGTRLWPLSRQNYPKQFLKLHGERSLLQQTFERVLALAPQKSLVVSNDAHYFLCQEQLDGYESAIDYILEPCARNTAPAIAAAALHLTQTLGEDAIMLVLPSDHWIANATAWQQAMEAGIAYAATHDALVTFGITPTGAHTGYGYIEAGDGMTSAIKKVNRFCEKPDEHTAKMLVQSGRYYWNSGMFVCRASVYLRELERFASDINAACQKALHNSQKHHDFLRLNLEDYQACRSESIDYAIMEQTDKAVVLPVNMEWSDLGCWTAVANANQQDENGNTLSGKVITRDSQNCFIASDDLLVTTLGINDQIIVATRDAVLIADKRYSQDVKHLVASLHQEHHDLTQDHPKVSRPWGYYEVLAEGTFFKVKRLMIKPGAKLSLQMHQHRAEHWVVIAGEALAVNDDQLLRLSVNQSTYIPQRTKHRLSNPGTEPLYLIEVQTGSYLGEDDIQRFDDIYARSGVIQES